MISSMTGYGRGGKLISGRDIGVEIRSVNHRFFEFSARLPRYCSYMEEKLKNLVYERVSRGKVDFSLTIIAVDSPGVEVAADKALAAGYLAAMRELSGELGIDDDVTLSSLARFHDIFTLRKAELDENALWNDVKTVAAEALEKYLAMRKNEGEKLAADIEERLAQILQGVAVVEERSPQNAEEYRNRLYQKMCEILEKHQIDEQRILQEAAIFAEKTAVAEETVRLRSHISQMREILGSGAPVGRKLDFLVQELNREVNTIGSKAQEIEISKVVVQIKSEIEKIREQIQNIE